MIAEDESNPVNGLHFAKELKERLQPKINF